MRISKEKYIFIFISILVVFCVCSFFINPQLDGISLENNQSVLIYGKTIIFICLLSTGVLVYSFIYKRIGIEKFFFLSILFFGCLYIFAITPLSSPDEKFHYQSAYSTSNIILNKDNPTEGESQDFDYTGYTEHRNVISGYERITQTIFISRKKNDVVISIPESYVVKHPQSYMFSSIGISIARILSLNGFWVYTFGRLANLLAFSLCVYVSLKRLPKYKIFFGIIALLPMTMQQASSYNYDAVIISFCFIMISSIIYSIFRKGKFTIAEMLWILIPGLIQAPIKAVYIFIVFSVFLIPKERFNSNVSRYMILFFIVIAVLIYGIYYYYNRPYLYWNLPSSGADTSETFSVSSSYTIKDIINNPIWFFNIFANSLIKYLIIWIAEMLGCALSGLTLPIFEPLIISFGLLVFVAMYSEKNDITKEMNNIIKLRVIFTSVFFMTSMATVVAMFISFTIKPSTTIEGVQGRYFLPVLPLIMLSLYIPKLKIKKNIDSYILTSCLILTSAVIINILIFTLTNSYFVYSAI